MNIYQEVHILTNEVTDTVAVGAITSPLWLHHLQTASAIAAILTPLLGGLWLAIQITLKITEVLKRSRKSEVKNDD